MFKITDGKGFSITFENDWQVSVQWGIGNYCSNRNLGLATGYVEAQRKAGANGAPSAECAVFNPEGDFVIPAGFGEDVQGYCDASEVMKILLWAQSQ